MTMLRLICAAALALLAGSALAHKGMHGPGSQYDQDGSGELSLAEYTTYLETTKQDVAAAAGEFAKLDKDKNGTLSSAEFIAGLPKGAAAQSNQ